MIHWTMKLHVKRKYVEFDIKYQSNLISNFSKLHSNPNIVLSVNNICKRLFFSPISCALLLQNNCPYFLDFKTSSSEELPLVLKTSSMLVFHVFLLLSHFCES